MGKTKKRVGLIGDGFWGTKIKQELQRRQDVSLAGVCTHDYGILLADPNIEHIFIATPVATHYKICKDALLAGKNIMCEKNFTQTYAETQELITLAAKLDRKIVVDYIHTFGLPDPPPGCLNEAGWIKIEIRQYGRFRYEHVMSVLGSHALSIAGTYFNISNLKLITKYEESSPLYAGLVTKSVSDWEVAGRIITIDVSLQHTGPEKIRRSLFYTNDAYCLGESHFARPNGIERMVDFTLNGGDNSHLAFNIAQCLEYFRKVR